ncbi:MAG: hypothetical protein HOP14_03300, partial [Acidobacteria bacterium]|nr:hypothetical protein [Acidobacteriota bacterium]
MLAIGLRTRHGETGGAQIYLINPQGGEAQPLTAPGAPVQSFEWSPDSRYVAFQTVDYNAARINLADIEKGDVIPIKVPDIANAR